MMHHALVLILCSFLTLGAAQVQPFKLGAENISPTMVSWLRNHRVGLVMNQTSKTQTGMRTVDLLTKHGIICSALLAPEHGIYGVIQASKDVDSSIDQVTKIPIISLYGNGTGKVIQASTLSDIDVLMFDIQDSGMRHYTYISTLYRVLEAAAQHDKPLVVLDRPNPLGLPMEGTLVDKQLQSFISIASIPLRHGMTIGELAHYFNEHVLEKKAQVHVVRMENYTRTMGLPASIVPNLSPNITNHASCLGYSFLGMLGEVRPFEVGVGTDKAFQCVMLPDSLNVSHKQWHELKNMLKKLNITSTLHTHVSARKKKSYTGLHLSIADINTVSSWTALLTVLQFFKKEGIALTCSDYFDKAAGSSRVRDFIAGKLSYAQLTAFTHEHLEQFHSKARSSFIYLPYPHITPKNS